MRKSDISKVLSPTEIITLKKQMGEENARKFLDRIQARREEHCDTLWQKGQVSKARELSLLIEKQDRIIQECKLS